MSKYNELNEGQLEPYLNAIEEKEDILILGAWNHGSYAWGLSNSKSDIDIKIVFSQKPSSYVTNVDYSSNVKGKGKDLELNEPVTISKSSIEYSGWDIKRFAELLSDNNPTPIETICSPIKYRTSYKMNNLEQYIRNNFNVIEIYNHYRGMGKKNYKKYIKSGKENNVKRNIYVVRSLLYAEYVKNTMNFPELIFEDFINNYEPNEKWDKNKIKKLIKLKKNGGSSKNLPFCKDAIEEMINDKIEEPQNYLRNNPISSNYIENILKDIYKRKTSVQ